MNALLIGATAVVALAAQSFGQYVIVNNVPDWHQAGLINPPNGPGGNPNGAYRAWCTPTAAANVMGFWQDAHAFNVADGAPYVSLGVIAWTPPAPNNWQDFEADASSIPVRGSGVARVAGSDLGWYLNTNDQGDQFTLPNNGGTPAGEQFAGTKRVNIVPGISNFLAAHGKPGATVTRTVGAIAVGWANIVSEINAGRPLLGEFDHFNIVGTPPSAVYTWGSPTSSDPGTGEDWDPSADLGHTTTIVGYVLAGAIGNPYGNVNGIVVQDSRRYSTTPPPLIVPEADNRLFQIILPFSTPAGQAIAPWAANISIDLCSAITGTVAGGGTICVGDSSSVTVTMAGGDGPYTVTLTNSGGTQTGPSPLTFNVSPAVNTTYALASGTDMHGCPMTGAGGATVVVNALPAAPTVPTATPASICSGSSSVLSATVPAGHTIDWFTVSCGGTAVPGGASPTVAPLGTTTYYARARNTGTGCVSASCAQVTVTVNANPTATATNDGPKCVGDSLHLTGGPGGMTTYAWTGPNGFASGAQSPTIANVTLAAGGLYTLTVTDANGCHGVATTTATINANPTATASNDGPKCVGDSLHLTGGLSGMTTYAWTGPNGFSSGAQNPTIPNVSLAAGGLYTLTVTNSNGCHGVATTTATVNANPTATAGNDGPKCVGDILHLTGGPSGMTTYAWTGPNGFSSGVQNPSISGVTLAAGGLYTLTVTDASGCHGVATTSATINPLPTAPTSASSSSTTICPGAVPSITLTASGGSGTTLRWYSGSCGGGIVGVGTPLIISSPTSTTTYYARWESALCGNSACASVTVTVLALATPPTSISSSANNYCSGSVANLTLTAVGGSGDSIQWFEGACGGSSIGATNPLIIAAPTSTKTYYARYVSTICGPSTCASTTVTVNPVTGACCTGYGTLKVCNVVLAANCAGATTPSRLYGGDCTTCVPHFCCAGDYNNNGVLAIQDIFDFIADWFNHAASADYNDSGGLSVQDIFDFLAGWFAGC